MIISKCEKELKGSDLRGILVYQYILKLIGILGYRYLADAVFKAGK